MEGAGQRAGRVRGVRTPDRRHADGGRDGIPRGACCRSSWRTARIREVSDMGLLLQTNMGAGPWDRRGRKVRTSGYGVDDRGGRRGAREIRGRGTCCSNRLKIPIRIIGGGVESQHGSLLRGCVGEQIFKIRKFSKGCSCLPLDGLQATSLNAHQDRPFSVRKL
jgi:hypothetical protein